MITPFRKRCYELLCQVPKGKVTTYSELARALGGKASRAVGTAMAKNKNPIIIPCHRVVRQDGSIGEYAFGVDKKISLLQEEGVLIENGKVKNFYDFFYRFEMQ